MSTNKIVRGEAAVENPTSRYEVAMRIHHGYAFSEEENSSSSGQEFDELYYRNKPPPLQIPPEKIVVIKAKPPTDSRETQSNVSNTIQDINLSSEDEEELQSNQPKGNHNLASVSAGNSFSRYVELEQKNFKDRQAKLQQKERGSSKITTSNFYDVLKVLKSPDDSDEEDLETTDPSVPSTVKLVPTIDATGAKEEVAATWSNIPKRKKRRKTRRRESSNKGRKSQTNNELPPTTVNTTSNSPRKNRLNIHEIRRNRGRNRRYSFEKYEEPLFEVMLEQLFPLWMRSKKTRLYCDFERRSSWDQISVDRISRRDVILEQEYENIIGVGTPEKPTEELVGSYSPSEESTEEKYAMYSSLYSFFKDIDCASCLIVIGVLMTSFLLTKLKY